MPFKKRTYGVKYVRPKSAGASRAKAFAAGARAVAATAARAVVTTPTIAMQNVRTGGFAGLENKFVDYTVSTGMSATWAGGELDDSTALSLSAAAQGDGESQRDGRTYYINSVHLRGTITQPSVESQTVPAPDVVVRLCLVWDTQSNGAQLNAEDVMKTVSSANEYQSFRNLQFSKRFIVLMDKTMVIPVARGVSNEGAINLFAHGDTDIFFKMNKKFSKGIKVRTTGTNATVSVTSDNSLHLIGVSESSSTLIEYTSRVRFSG